MEEHFVFPPEARTHDQSRRQKTALLQTEIRKAVKRSVVAGSSFDRTSRTLHSELHERARNWLCTTVGWEMSRQESVAPWCYHRSMSMTSNSISRKSRDGHPPITNVAKGKSGRDKS